MIVLYSITAASDTQPATIQCIHSCSVVSLRISYAVFVDSKHGLTLRQAWTVIYFTNSRIASTLPQTEPRSRRVRHNVAANRLLGVRIEHGGRSVHRCNHLIGHHYCNSELVRQPQQTTQEASEMHLSGSQLSSAAVVSTVECSGAVDYQQRIPALCKHTCRLYEQLGLMVAIVRTSVRDVVKYVSRVEAELLCNGHQSLRTEGALCVDVQRLTFAATLLQAELAGYTQCVAQLSLA